MTYVLKFIVERPTGRHTLVTGIAGCRDEADAREKLHRFYTGVVKILSITTAPRA